MLLVGLIAIVLLVLVSFPLVGGRQQPVDPAADAEATFLALAAQVDAGAAAGSADRLAGVAEPAGSTESAIEDAGAAPGGTAAAAPRRDLFAPRPPTRPASAPASRRSVPRRPQRPPLPRLSGILIDGASRRAMLGKQLAAVGDTVGGYRLVAIESDHVTLAWDLRTFEIEVGAN
jgi:hypothetical protein